MSTSTDGDEPHGRGEETSTSTVGIPVHRYNSRHGDLDFERPFAQQGSRGTSADFSQAELLAATGQSITPSMLADQERLMHERRIMAYHNTRLVLALQGLGAAGEAALAGLQRRTGGRRECVDCDAAQIQLDAMDKTLARASLTAASAREQVSVVKSNLNSVSEENRSLRAALLRCDEMIRVKDSEIAVLRGQVQQTQPAMEEVLALRRTQSDLLQRIRLLQEAEPVVRIVESRSAAASIGITSSPPVAQPKTDASVQLDIERDTPSLLRTSRDQAGVPIRPERHRRQLLDLEWMETSARIEQISRFFDFHHLVGILWRTEGTAAELRRANTQLLEERQRLEDALEDATLRCNDLRIELRTEKTRTDMQSVAPVLQLPPLSRSSPSPGDQEALARRRRAESDLKAEVWGWAVTRVQSTLDDAMAQIQRQVDEAYEAGYNAGVANGSVENLQAPRGRETDRHRHPGSIDSVTSIDDS
jgi:hypothetical protein